MTQRKHTGLLLALLGAFTQPLAATPEHPPVLSSVFAQTRVLQRRVAHLRDRHLVAVQIEAPSLPKVPELAHEQHNTTAAELAAEARRAAKLSVFTSLSVEVHPGAVSEVSWTYDDRAFHAYSSIDFRLLCGLAEIETETAVASWFCVPMEACEGELAPELRAQLALSPAFAEYVVDATEAEMAAAPEAFVVLDAIHAYFDANRAQLIARYAKLRAEAASREAAALANPQPPPDTTVYLWRVNQ